LKKYLNNLESEGLLFVKEVKHFESEFYFAIYFCEERSKTYTFFIAKLRPKSTFTHIDLKRIPRLRLNLIGRHPLCGKVSHRHPLGVP